MLFIFQKHLIEDLLRTHSLAQDRSSSLQLPLEDDVKKVRLQVYRAIRLHAIGLQDQRTTKL